MYKLDTPRKDEYPALLDIWESSVSKFMPVLSFEIAGPGVAGTGQGGKIIHLIALIIHFIHSCVIAPLHGQ